MIKNKIPSKTSYLSNCDFINKYSLHNIKEAPFLSKVTLELSSLDIFNALEKTNQSDSNSETKIRLFLILYIFKLFQPKIHCDSSVKAKEINNGFLLRINFSTEKSINNLLTVLFTENWSKPIFRNSASNNKKFSSFKATADTFFGVKEFLNKNLSEIDSSKLRINYKFIFENKNLRNQVVSIKMIKNMTPFWISC